VKILLYGIGKYTGEMAAWLAARGHQVRVVTAPPYYPDCRFTGAPCHEQAVIASPPNPARYRTRTLNRAFVTASVARQSMQSEVMDCHVAGAPRNDEAGGMDCHVAGAPRNDGHFRNDESNSRHCEPPESGPIPHTDLEPDPVTASEARQSMQSRDMDYVTLFAMTERVHGKLRPAIHGAGCR